MIRSLYSETSLCQTVGKSEMYTTAAKDKGVESVKNNGTSTIIKEA